MVKAIYYQKVYTKAIDAPEPFSDLVEAFIFFPRFRRLLRVSTDDIRQNPVYSLLTDEDDLADAYKVYKGVKRNGRIRFREVRIFEYEKSDIQKLVRSLDTLEEFQAEVANDLERLVSAANPPLSAENSASPK